MTTLTTTYERQNEARLARERVRDTYDRIYFDLDPRARGRTDIYQHPDMIAAQAEAERLAAEVAKLREQVGGRVFRVVDSKLDELRERIEKLNKKAEKLGTDAITLTVSDEHDQTTFTEDGVKRIIDYTFVTVDGETPMIEGWVFLATLDHDADGGADESVGIRRAPVGTSLINRIGEDAARAVETADLTRYRHAGPDCDHCRLDRRRKQTYVLYEIETGELRQIGSTCLRDYTGAHNPERVAAWAEWVEALYSDLDSEGDGGFGGGGGRIAISTREYLAHVAAMIRERGWKPRWTRDYGDFERNPGATADAAMSNLFERDRRYRVEVTDGDRELASTALTWVRDDLAERDELDEFQHNLVTYTRGDYLPEKGDGFVAAAIGAYRRETERKLERERASESEWIGEPKQRIKGLTFTVTFTKVIDGLYGTKLLTKGHDGNGNLLIWWASGGTWLEEGHTYELTATIKAHDRDSYQGDAKVTEITRVHGASVKDITRCEECGEQLRPDPEKYGSMKAEVCSCIIKAREEADAKEAAEKAAFDAEHAELREIYDRVRARRGNTQASYWSSFPFESFVATAERNPELIEALVKTLDEEKLDATKR